MLVRFGGIFVILAFFVWMLALVDAITAEESAVRHLPKMVWIGLLLISADVGAVLWFLAGRPRRPRRPPSARRSPRGPLSPDDDPEFLRSLDRERRGRGGGDGSDRDPGRP
jgi:hypothetical protein